MALVSSVDAPVDVSNAIRKASKATGANFEYLLTTAARESNFKPQAKAKTSSAAGLFQFIESTWLQTLKEEGASLGLGEYSPHIFKTSGGRYYVPNRQLREDILKLRHDPEASAMMAGAFTQQNAEYVGSRLGREPTQGELYIAHFLGPGGATKLISLASENPSARADRQFPLAAQANRGIFYSGGRPRSASQVYDLLVSDHSRMEALTVVAASPATAGAREDAAEAELPGDGVAPVTRGVWAQDTGIATESLAQILGQSKPADGAAKTRVASLGGKALAVEGATMTDAGLGSIGPWHTIVERAGGPTDAKDASAIAPAAGKPVSVKRPVPLPARKPRAQPIQIAAREPASPPRRAMTSAVRMPSAAFELFASDYWRTMGMSGS